MLYAAGRLLNVFLVGVVPLSAVIESGAGVGRSSQHGQKS